MTKVNPMETIHRIEALVSSASMFARGREALLRDREEDEGRDEEDEDGQETLPRRQPAHPARPAAAPGTPGVRGSRRHVACPIA
jgi:hypothetical protein